MTIWAKLVSVLAALWIKLLSVREANIARSKIKDDRETRQKETADMVVVHDKLKETVQRTDDKVVDDLNSQFGWKP